MSALLDDCLVIVLAGGAGERLYPLTKDRAKPAVYFGGPYRIIDFALSNAINSGLRRIFIATQYKSLSLNRHIRMGWGIVSEELGEIIAIDEHERVTGFQEKPKQASSIPGSPDFALASMGVYIFDTDVLVRALEADAARPTTHDFGKDIIPGLIHDVP